MGAVSTREQSIARMADVMRDFMANAVLFQDAVAAPAAQQHGPAGVSLLMSEGPATPVSWRTHRPERRRRHHRGDDRLERPAT